MNKPKNILLIVSDQHHAGAMSWAGHPIVETPNLDRLAQHGTAFTGAWCTNPLCVPARASMLSGRYSYHNGVYSLGATFRDDMPTYAHVAEAAGLEAVIAGRMHLVWNDRLHGHRQRFNPEPYRDIRNNREYWRDDIRENDYTKVLENAGPGYSKCYVSDRQSLTKAQEFISRSDKPWLMTACFYQPHHPYDAPQKWWVYYNEKDIPLPEPVPQLNEVHAQQRDLHKFRGFDKRRPNDEAVRKALVGYYGSVSSLDEMLGWLFASLEDAGQLEDTLIIYTSDHGDQLGEHGGWEKSYLYEGSINVPLIVSGPGVRHDVQIDRGVSHVDLLPTIAESLDFELSNDLLLDGHSLWSLCTGKDDPNGTFWNTRPILAEYADYGVRAPAAAIRVGDHKLIAAEGHPYQCFDLSEDHNETLDLANDDEQADLVNALAGELAAHWDPVAVRRHVLRDQAGFQLIERAHDAQGFLGGNWPPAANHNLGVVEGT